MRRKIIQQKSAFTLTLPVNWIRDHNLKASDDIEINTEGNNLIVSTERHNISDKITLNLDKGNESYYRIMIENHYLKGYDVIEINLQDKNALAVIKRIVSNLNGVELVEQHGNYCRISQTAMPGAEEFKTLLKRALNITKYSEELILKDIQDNSFKNLKEIEQLTEDLRRFMLFCTRTIHKINVVPRKEESFMHLLLERLILIQHNEFYMYRKLARVKRHKIRKSVIELYSRATRMFSLFSEMFSRKDFRHFSETNSEWEKIYFKDGQALFHKCTEEESIIIYHAMYLSKQVFLISQPNLIMQNV